MGGLTLWGWGYRASVGFVFPGHSNLHLRQLLLTNNHLVFFSDHRKLGHVFYLTPAWELLLNCLRNLRLKELEFHGKMFLVSLHLMKTSTWPGCFTCSWHKVQFMQLLLGGYCEIYIN